MLFHSAFRVPRVGRLDAVIPDLMWWIGASVLLVGSFLVVPADLPMFDLCLFHAVTGFPCPGCGLTRSLCCISHGAFGPAWTQNPFGYVLYPVLLAVFFWPLTGRSFAKAMSRFIKRRACSYGLLFLVTLMLTFDLWRISR